MPTDPHPADVELVADILDNFFTLSLRYETEVGAERVLAALAAAGRLVPVDEDQGHVIEFREDGWTIKHPLSCRLGDLFDCPVNRAAEVELRDGPPAPPGRYECGVTVIGNRFEVGNRIEAAS